MEQQLANLDERLAFAICSVDDLAGKVDALTEKVASLDRKADTAINLLRDIRDLLIYRCAAPGRHLDDVMNEIRGRASHVTDR